MVLRPPRIGRIGLVVAACAIAATLFFPALRELQWLNLRLLCHIPIHGTCVQGQPEGCCVFIVPHVQLTPERVADLQTTVARSPESYILVGRAGTPVAFPEGRYWKGNPLLEWAALEAASRPRPYQSSTTIPSTTTAPREEGLPPIITRDGHVLETISTAQSASPENGALWVAQAVVLFENGRDAAGLAAIETACTKEVWTHEFPNAFPHLRRVWEQAGHSSLDANMYASVSLVWGAISSLDMRIREHLMLLAARSVAAGNDAELGRLISLFNRYRACARQRGSAGREFSMNDHRELTEALRVALQREPFDLNTASEIQERIAGQWLDEYLDVHVDPALAVEFRRENAAPVRRLARRYDRYARFSSALDLAMTSSMPGMLSLLLMAVILAVLVAEIPYRLFFSPQNASPRISPRFAIAAGLALAVMTCIVFGTVDSFVHPVGLRAITETPLLTSSQENLVFSTFLAICLVVLRGACWRVPQVFRAGVIILFCLYLSALTVTAQVRGMAAEQCAVACE